MNADSYEFLQITVDEGLANVVLNRPEKLNAVRGQDHAELGRFLKEYREDDDLLCAVVTGAGRAFCVGGDYSLLEETVTDPLARLRTLEEARDLVNAHLDLEKPIIAAINGLISGAGAAFGLLCDITIADRSARIADGHIVAALAAGDGGMLTWPLNVGMAKAKRYLLTGDWIGAEEAERIGLISDVVDDGQCLASANALARRMVEMPQTAIRYTKRALNCQLRDTSLRSFELSLALEMLSQNTGETQELAAQWQVGSTPDHHGLASGS